MGLFNKLFYLRLRNSNNPYEDYLTEIFAECLKDLTLQNSFLSMIGIGQLVEQLTIKTQQKFKKLENHDSDSIPDVTLYGSELNIFIEAKLGSSEGYNQLQRYAEHLDKLNGKKVLLYLTRDYDPKSKEKITKKCSSEIEFFQLRWHQVYGILKDSKNQLIIELKKYMEDNRMNSTNQFTPLDIIALTNFSRVKRIMDETMYGEVYNKFQSIFKNVNKDSSSMTQIRDHDRYIYYSHRQNGLWVGFGYWLNSFSEKNYPVLKLFIELNPNSSKYSEIVTVFKTISEKENSLWKGYNLNESKNWSGISISSNLKEHLGREDHVQSVKEFFLRTLNEYERIKDDFGGLI